MGLCVKCKNFFHPIWMIEMEKDDEMCLFCYKDKDKIELENGTIVRKKDCTDEYQKYMKKLVDRNQSIVDEKYIRKE